MVIKIEDKLNKKMVRFPKQKFLKLKFYMCSCIPKFFFASKFHLWFPLINAVKSTSTHSGFIQSHTFFIFQPNLSIFFLMQDVFSKNTFFKNQLIDHVKAFISSRLPLIAKTRQTFNLWREQKKMRGSYRCKKVFN